MRSGNLVRHTVNVGWWQLRAPEPIQVAATHSRLNLRLMPLVSLVGGSSMGLLGIGGGLLATPLFTGLFGQRQTVAQSLSLAFGGLFTVSAGVAFAHRLPEHKMHTAFAWMLLCTAIWLLLRPFILH